MSPIERRQQLLEVLNLRRQDTYDNLASEFDVSRRTICRDIAVLMCSYPIETARGYAGGVKIAEWFHLSTKTFTPTLIAGLHRLEAVKMLGWTEIECTVNDLDGLLAELAEIDENLIRRKLHYTDEGKQLARRKEIYEALHPETQQGKRNGQTSKKDTVSVLEAKPFAEDAAEQLGTTARSVRRKIQVSQKLAPEVQDLAKKENIRFRDALKLSRLPPEQQEAAARQLAAETIRSVDEYHPVQVEPEPPGEEQPPTEPTVPASTSEGGYYATIRDSVADLKNPDKDRGRTPEMFLTYKDSPG